MVGDLVPHGGTSWGQGGLLDRQGFRRSGGFCFVFGSELCDIEETNVVGFVASFDLGEKFVFHGNAVSAASHVEVFQF